MSPVSPRLLAAVVAAVLIGDLIAVATVGGPGGGAALGHPAAAAPVSTTTTTLVRVGTFPLTGLPAYSAAHLARPALSIKIDNAPDARPQAGLNAADIVTEEVVEGGITRLLASFQSQDSPSVGPIRSARPVDADLLHELGGGLFAFSGASAGAIAPVTQRAGAVFLTPDTTNGVFVRAADRPAPANLFAPTAGLYAQGARLGPHVTAPPALFTFGTAPPAGAGPGRSVSLRFSPSSSGSWDYDTPSGMYRRSQNGTPVVGTDGSPVTAADVVVLSVATAASRVYDVLGNQSPLTIVTGTGTGWVMRDGAVIHATWKRLTYQDPLQLLGVDGHTIPLHPGRTWIELLPTPAQPTFG